MKAFRGTLLALAAFLLCVGAWYLLQPPKLTPKERKELREKEQGVELFKFEKADLVKVEVVRPTDTIVISEQADGWLIEGEKLRASRNMVNRFKHQLHDLVARATVAEDAADPETYGLGASAVRISLHFRDGSVTRFRAGDPNPSGVSFYIQLENGTIYTVKKSAVDFYTLSLSEFRERRFATFDSKDVDVLEATRADGSVLKFQRTGEHSWDMLSPKAIPAADDEVRSLLGRVSAMKAIRFEAEGGDDARYGFDSPRLKVALRFAGRDPMTLVVGKATGDKDGEYDLSYARLEGEPSVYAVRDGLLEDYAQDAERFRLTRFARIDSNDLVSMTTTYAPPDPEDQELAGTVTVRQAAQKWQWEGGEIVSGSTPRRLATRAANIDGVAFVAESGEDAAYGFDKPVATIGMVAQDGGVRTLLVGKAAPSELDPEGRERKRRYARMVEFPEIYVVDDGVLDVVEDLMREHGRYARGETEQAERQERVEREKQEKKPE